jgi:hypothetical protein
MLNVALKRFMLPFAPQKSRGPFNDEVEEAAVYALAELERMKGGGLILKQPEEKLVFLAKIGYPLWLFPKNETSYIFDDLKNAQFTMSYLELPSAKSFMDSLEANSKTREDFMAFLSDHNNYFSQPQKEKEVTFGSLIVDLDFKKEFNTYRREGLEITGQAGNYALLSPVLEEAKVSSVLDEIFNLQMSAKEDSEKLAQCLRFINRTTGQYVTDLDYAAEAAKDEVDATIRAQSEFINPKVAALNSQYKRRIAEIARSFNQELETLEKQKAKNEKNIESNEGKIRLYQREAEAQASKNHSIYEKRWKEKSAQAKKELNGLKKELKRAEKNIKNLTKQKKSQTAKLQLELEAEIKRARQPLLDLEADRDAKMLVFKRETEKLLKLEKPVVNGLNDAVKIGEAVNAKFAMLGSVDPQLKSPALFYVPFYAAFYQAGLSNRFIFLSPSMANEEGFGSKLKGAFGRSKIKQLLIPRFKAISGVIDNMQVLSKQNSLLASQIRSLGEKNNLLNSPIARSNIAEGLLRLRSKGWLSDKEYQVVIDSLHET